MGEWDNNYGNNDYNDGFGSETHNDGFHAEHHDESHSESHDDSQDDRLLDEMFAEESSEETTGNDADATQETQAEESDELMDMEDVVDNMYKTPRNATNEKKFSEKETYMVINTVMAMSNMEEEQKKAIDSVLNLGGDDVRRSMKIVEMGASKVEEKASTMEVLGLVQEIASKDEDASSLSKLLSVMKIIGDLDSKDKNALVTLARKIKKNHPTDYVLRINKNSSDAEIVEGIRDMILSSPEIDKEIREMSECFDVIKTAIK